MEQSYTIIDFENWERKYMFQFFDTFHDPNISITTDIECTGLIQTAKMKGYSPYLVYMYCIHQALNAVENLKYRLSGTEVWLFNYVEFEIYIKANHSSLPIPIVLEWQDNFEDYHRINKEKINLVKQGKVLERPFTDRIDLALVSSTPDLYFTAIKHACREAHNSSPLVNTGKAVKRGDKEFMPVALTTTHAFVDGAHIQQFFDLIHSNFKLFVTERQ